MRLQHTVQYEQLSSPNYCDVAAQAYLCKVRVYYGIVRGLNVSRSPDVFISSPDSMYRTEPTSSARKSQLMDLSFRSFYSTSGLVKTKKPETGLLQVNPFPHLGQSLTY